MSVGFAVMAHSHPQRVSQLVRYLSNAGARVVLHLDTRMDGGDLAGLASDTVLVMQKYACDWGRFELVEAARDAAATALKTWSEISHVCLLSGSCLPVRPLAEFQRYLAEHPDQDLMETVPATEGAWVRDGLSFERFTLHFPVGFRTHRKLFDRLVDIQRKLGIRRKIPFGLEPHIGSQWWCLSRKTLECILSDPDGQAIDRYFRTTFIPDESYFQTMAMRHGADILSRSPTFARFDAQGKPFVFHDDHGDMLAGCGRWFARKIWPKADGLYDRFLSDRQGDGAEGLDTYLDQVLDRRTRGRPGLIMPGRHTARGYEKQFATPGAYAVFEGFGEVLSDLRSWLESQTGTCAHGYLFGESHADFSPQSVVTEGNLAGTVALRDRMAAQFLIRLLWNRSEPHHSFFFEPPQSKRMAEFIVQDPNATLFRLRGLSDQATARDTFLNGPTARANIINLTHEDPPDRLADIVRQNLPVRNGITPRPLVLKPSTKPQTSG